MSKDLIKEIAKPVGGIVALSAALGLSRGAVSQWDRVPDKWIVEVERITGVHRSKIRPDLYEGLSGAPPEPAVSNQEKAAA